MESSEYNDQGNVEQDTDGDGNTTVYTYGDDTNPNLVTKEVTSNGGTVISQTEYTYDDAGRVTAEADAVADTESVYTYTDDPEQGYQVSTTEKQDEKTVSVSEEQYDAEGNLLNEENEAGGITVSSTNEYDEMGNLLESVSSDGSRTVYTYDFLGRLTKQQDYDKEGTLAQTLETSYFPNGQVKNETAADGTVTGYTYDSRNRLVTRKVTADGNTRTWTAAYGYGSVNLQDGRGTVSVPNAAKVTETDPAGMSDGTLREAKTAL